MRREKGDYSRAEEYMESIGEQIEFEWGTPYKDLSKEEQVQAILDHFFKGIPQYYGSARSLRQGITATQTGLFQGTPIKISRIRHHIAIRDAKTGRFKKWVKE